MKTKRVKKKEKRLVRKKVIALILLVVLFFILIIVLGSSLFENINISINENVQSLQTPILNKIMTAITFIGNLNTMLILSLVLLLFLIFRKRKNEFIFSALCLFFTAILTETLKLIFQKQRPIDSLINYSGYSFPSSHAAGAIIFFSLLIYLFKDEIESKLKGIFLIVIGILLPILIGFSRIYLNAHWLSDVLAGFITGLFVLFFFILIFNIKKGK